MGKKKIFPKQENKNNSPRTPVTKVTSVTLMGRKEEKFSIYKR